MEKIALGTSKEVAEPDCIKALVVEFIVTFLFVFIGVAATMTAGQLAGSALLSLFVVAVTHAIVVAVMISAGHVSGGHLNPSVTLGLLVGGHITVFRSIFYCIAQMLASTSACFLLKYLTGLSTPVITLAAGTGSMQGVVWEIILTFILLFTIYATIVHEKKGAVGGQGALLTGLVVGANIMAGANFSGASMNPARCFGPALVSGIWTDHWVYWVGPLIGAGLAGFVYENIFVDRPPRHHQAIPSEDECC